MSERNLRSISHSHHKFSKLLRVNFYLSVLEIRKMDKSKVVTEGGDLIIECPVEGHPPPGIQWYKGMFPWFFPFMLSLRLLSSFRDFFVIFHLQKINKKLHVKFVPPQMQSLLQSFIIGKIMWLDSSCFLKHKITIVIYKCGTSHMVYGFRFWAYCWCH